jgi:hypothetical protein
MKKLLVSLLLGGLALAQTSVILAPVPKLQFFDNSGRPLAFGCVFTYVSTTVTPLATYTDYTGTTLNANPVILSAGGFASIWLQAGVSYTLRVKSAGGSNCASGTQLYSVDGISGASSQATTIVPFSPTPQFTDSSQNQLFTITLTGNAVSQPLVVAGVTPPGLITWQITQDGVGGRTFGWPVNVVGGAPVGTAPNQVTTQHFIWNGSNATALGPAVTGIGPSLSTGAITATGAISGSSTLSITGAGTFGGDLSTSGNLITPTFNGVSLANGLPTYVIVANSGTGTTLNTLTKITGAPSKAQIVALTDTNNVIGVTISGAGAAGNAVIQTAGIVSCVFDNATTAGDFVRVSVGTAGNCHDAGAVANPGEFIGQVLSTNGGAGTYLMLLRLSTQTQLFTANGTPASFSKLVVNNDTIGGGGTSTWTYLGAAVFNATPICLATDRTAANAVAVTATSTAGGTVTGTIGDNYTAICFGD